MTSCDLTNSAIINYRPDSRVCKEYVILLPCVGKGVHMRDVKAYGRMEV
jgi:hypothetical protein